MPRKPGVYRRTFLRRNIPKWTISNPPRSPDLTPLDAFVWGLLKEQCLRDPIPTVPELKDNVERVISRISDVSLVGMVENIRNRMEMFGEWWTTHGTHRSLIMDYIVR